MVNVLERRFEVDGTRSLALYSPCETYRYGLSRDWGNGQRIMFVMLNPSTATERANDPTIERCERRARQMGGGGLVIANLFAYRATRPADLKSAADPIGPDTDRILAEWRDSAQLCIAAWGVHGTHLCRNEHVLKVLRGPLHHLGLTRDGHPRHPLYVPYATQPEIWRMADGTSDQP